VLPEGWAQEVNMVKRCCEYKHTDGRIQEENPGKPDGIIAIANAIPDMGALSLANVMGNRIGKEMLSKLQEIMRSNPNLVSLCGIADDATEIDLSGLGMDADDAIILASELPDKRVLMLLNLASNNLGQLVLPVGWTKQWNEKLNDYGYKHIDGREQKEDPSKPDGIIVLASAIKDMGAMTSLNLASNDLSAQGTKLLAAALKGNLIMIELNISSNKMTWNMNGSTWGGMSGIITLADVIPDMRALSTFTFSGDYDSGHVTMETTMTEADFSGKKLGVSGGMMVAAFLPKCQ
jgi:hypothetical protein